VTGDDDGFMPYFPMGQLTALDLPEIKELYDLVWPVLQDALGGKQRGPLQDLVAAEMRRRVHAREIEASQAGLLRGLRDALTSGDHADLQAEIADAVAGQLRQRGDTANRADVLEALRDLLATPTPGSFTETQRVFLDRIGRLFLESLTQVEVNDKVRADLHAVAEYDTDAALALLERDLGFILHPLVAFRLITWRTVYRAAADEPDIPLWADAADPHFAKRRERNVERAKRAAKLLADPTLARNRGVDREGFRNTFVLVTNNLRAVERMWRALLEGKPSPKVKADFPAFASALTGASVQAVKALMRRQDAFGAARRIEIARQYPTRSFSPEAVRKWIKLYIVDDPEGDPTLGAVGGPASPRESQAED
jgi:hypothetical protein